ncbi:phage head closure protein [Thioclava sp. GXIMD4215]|uniref:phage head closure protein n=1 Tax=Thioclava sp. GXIMD4215 TaxID=3131928 RepID=UPI003245919B
MKIGRMIHTITIERGTTVTDDYGTPVFDWVPVAILRAEVVERSTTEFFRDTGAADEEAIVFRTWFKEGVTNEDRVSWQGRIYDLKQVTPIGMNKGLELRCTGGSGEGS